MSFLLSLSCFSQDLKQKGDTLYYKVTPTGKFFKDKDGLVYTVYRSKTNKLFIIKTSKKSGIVNI